MGILDFWALWPWKLGQGHLSLNLSYRPIRFTISPILGVVEKHCKVLLTTTLYTSFCGSVILKIRSRSPIFELVVKVNQVHNRSIFGSCSWKHCKVMLTTSDHNILDFWASVTLTMRSYHISQNWEEGLCAVPDGILIKYHIKIHCKRLSHKWAKFTFSKIH